MPLPPPPIQDPSGSFAWLDWFRQLRTYISQTGSVPWSVVNKAGSNISDIVTRNHNNLQNIQGGTVASYYHLTHQEWQDIQQGYNHNNLQNIQGGTVASYYHLRTYLTATLSAYNFASVAAHTTSTTTVTVIGATTSDFVIVRLSTAAESGMVYDAYVSAADTVTIRAINTTAAIIDPSSRDYIVLVIR